MRRLALLGPLTLLLALGLYACDGGDGASDEPAAQAQDDVVVWPGKEDNFISLSALEYLLEGKTQVTLEPEYAERSEEERLARVQELIPLKSIQVGWFLNVFLSEKKSGDSNYGYGGYHALVREGSYKTSDVEAVPEQPLTYSFLLRFEIGGDTQLLSQIKELEQVEGDLYRMTLSMARVSNTQLARLDVNSEWYRSYESWVPTGKSPESIETIDLTIRPEPRSSDAYFDIQRLVEDGVVTVAVHFGWDYHKDYHLLHSRSLYDWLLGKGFQSPVASYDDYVSGGDAHSGPLTRTLKTPQGDVQLEVSLFWGKPGTATDPDTAAGGIVLENDMRDSLRDREIIAYSGHSGPYYGFALANWRKTDEGDLDDSELPEVEMPEDTYQIVLAEGCDTYGVGEAFWHNPAKADRLDLDVITTTAPSNASTPSTVQDFITALLGVDARGMHKPTRVSDLLRELDSNSSWFHTMYGLHGVDDNPQRHPYGREELLCNAGCSTADECGGNGNRCVQLGAGEKVCTFECTSDAGCPDGFGCERIARNRAIEDAMVCVPRSTRCGVGPTPEHGTLNQAGSVAKGEEQHYQVVVGANVPRLLVSMTGTGDADLYLRFGEAPTAQTWDCRPYGPDSDEECKVDGPKAGTYHVMVRGYAAQSDYEVKAVY